MPHRRIACAALLALAAWAGGADAFAPSQRSVPAERRLADCKSPQCNVAASTQLHNRPRRITPASLAATAIDDVPVGAWTSLVDATGENDAPPVRKHILEEGGGDSPAEGSTVEIEYTGTLLGEKDWSANDVAACWLSQLQGLDHLAPTFLENVIDASKLMDDAFFTEEYCMDTLGISNKIQAKKLVMTSKRLAKQQKNYPSGTEFDSSTSRGKNYSFALGTGKAIRAIDLAVASMTVGERAMVACRADYGYGAEGLRTSKGEVLVPPFATLCFEIKLVSAA